MNKTYVHWQAIAEPYKINLTEFDPFDYGKSLNIKKIKFFGGEQHIQILDELEYFGELSISSQVSSMADLFDIVLTNDAARRMGFTDIKLFMPYMMGGRQDRVCNTGEPLTVKIVADMINSCGFSEVTILTPHSEVTPALINNVRVMDELDFIEDIIMLECDNSREFNIVCPDAGAGKRVNKVVQHLTNAFPEANFNLIRCEKVRDVKDGSLKDFFVQADVLHGHPTLICDDINSMAGTFIGLGKKLKEKGCGKLMLFTTHSDCVEGIQRAVEFFDHVFTTNSRKNWGDFRYTLDGKFTCFNLRYK